jgi:hypothetical protein
MKRLYTISNMVAAIAAIGALAVFSSGCALDGSSQTDGTQEGVSSSVNDIASGRAEKERQAQDQQTGKSAQDPHQIMEQGLAPQPQPWRTVGSDDPNQPQPQPWSPNPDPSDPNNQKK